MKSYKIGSLTTFSYWFNQQSKLLRANLVNLLLAFIGYHIAIFMSIALVVLDMSFYNTQVFVNILIYIYIAHGVLLFIYIKNKELSKGLSYKLRMVQLFNWLGVFALWCYFMPNHRELTLICSMMIMTFLFAYSTFKFSLLINFIVGSAYLLICYISAHNLAIAWKYSYDITTVLSFLACAMLMGFMVHRTTLQLKNQAHNDFLTGLLNRRAMSNHIEAEFARCARFKTPASVVMIDLDNFKYINDHYGHACGDLVLKHVASEFTKQFREVDFISRWGGEEFMMLLIGVKPEQAKLVLERALVLILNDPMPFEKETVKVSFSAGVSCLINSPTAEEAIKEADNLLYQAKEQGKCRICI